MNEYIKRGSFASTEIDFARIDLNLLRLFDAVMQDRSLTRAAARTQKSVPMLSRAMRRLSDQVGSPLFIKHDRGMVPTQLANELAPLVRSVLDQLKSGLTAERSFVPATSSRIFVIDIPVGGDFVIAPALHELAAREAPGVSFQFLAEHSNVLREQLRSGETHAAIDYNVPTGEGMRHELVYADPFVVVARKGHPIFSRTSKLTMQAYMDLEHVGLAWTRTRGDGPVVERVNRAGVTRNFKLTLSTLATMGPVIARSDLVATLSERVARRFSALFEVEYSPLPFKLDPIPIRVVWHQRFDHDPGHAWLRDALRRACNDM